MTYQVKKPLSKSAFQVHNVHRYKAAAGVAEMAEAAAAIEHGVALQVESS
jgi:hypothetical protein